MQIKLVCACIKSIFNSSWAAELGGGVEGGSRAGGGGGGLQPPSFCQIFRKSPFFASNLSISMPTAPARSSQPPHFQIYSAIYAHLNRIHEVVIQIKIIFFHNFTPLIAKILAFKLYLCCQKVDFAGPVITITAGHITFCI